MMHKVLCPARIGLFGATCTCYRTSEELEQAQEELLVGDTLFND